MTREEAIKVIQEYRDMASGCNLDHDVEGFDMAIESLSAETEWIPVSDRLPNVGQDVLFCDDKFTQEGYLMKDGNWLQFRWSTVQGKRKVTAWMPLPKPYGERREP